MIKNHEVVKAWTGLMPFPADGHALIGKINCIQGEVFIVSGLSSMGMMRGPGAGKLLAEMMNGNSIAKTVLREADPNRCIKKRS